MPQRYWCRYCAALLVLVAYNYRLVIDCVSVRSRCGLNYVFDRDFVGFVVEFIPMLVFGCSLFVYMIVLIFVKWSIDWSSPVGRMAMHPPGGEDMLRHVLVLWCAYVVIVVVVV